MIKTPVKMKVVTSYDCTRCGSYARKRIASRRDYIIKLLHLNSKLSKRLIRVNYIKYFPKKIKSKYIRKLRKLLFEQKEELCRLT